MNFLIYNQDFESSLHKRLKETKDFFVFGCTVGLRISDLLLLSQSNLHYMNGHYYLSVKSKKTATDTLVQLPDYALSILKKYKGKKLLPFFNKSNLNTYIKQLLEKAGFNQVIIKTRQKRGRTVQILKDTGDFSCYRFCDVASTHTMRRTAITVMLTLGLNEQIVRRISGHAPQSKEFYRYVQWAQAYQDKECEKMFEKLKQADEGL